MTSLTLGVTIRKEVCASDCAIGFALLPLTKVAIRTTATRQTGIRKDRYTITLPHYVGNLKTIRATFRSATGSREPGNSRGNESLIFVRRCSKARLTKRPYAYSARYSGFNTASEVP